MPIKKWRVDLDGLEELVVAIEEATPKSIEQSNKVIKNKTEKVARNARKRAPVDTWFMHDNITTDYEGEASEFVTGIIESPAGYSGYVEYGTRFNIAQPFLGPSVEEIVPELTSEMLKVSKGLFK